MSAQPRILKLFELVTPEWFDRFFDRYVELRAESRAPITLLFNSDGGDVDVAISAFDLIRGSDVPIHGLVVGLAHSSACIILQACKTRTALPHATLMIHEGTIGEDADALSPNEKAQNLKWSLGRMELSTRSKAKCVLVAHKRLESSMRPKLHFKFWAFSTTIAPNPREFMHRIVI